MATQDVPAANVIIRFDALHNTISLAQGRGRGRQDKSSQIVLSERQDRPVSLLSDIESKQGKLLQDFKPGQHAPDAHKEHQAQLSRERGALGVLGQDLVSGQSLHVLNTYRTKTKATVHEDSSRARGSNKWVYKLTYESVLREVSAEAEHASKKTAKAQAAAHLIAALHTATSVMLSEKVRHNAPAEPATCFIPDTQVER